MRRRFPGITAILVCVQQDPAGFKGQLIVDVFLIGDPACYANLAVRMAYNVLDWKHYVHSEDFVNQRLSGLGSLFKLGWEGDNRV